MVNSDDFDLEETGGWRVDDTGLTASSWRRTNAPGWVVDEAGKEAVFTVTGANIGIAYHYSGDSAQGRVAVSVDSGEEKIIDSYFGGGYSFPNGAILANGLENTEHTVRVRLLDEGKRFILCGLLVSE